MPFTFSHPAIVLPGYYLPQRWRSLTGLIAGSVAPDFEMFLRMKAINAYSHTWHSIFWFNLPMAIVLAFLFHLVVRNSLIDHLPLFLRQRLNHFKRFNWTLHFKKQTAVVVVSILVGIASHIFWDSFTHEYGIFIRWFPLLEKEVTLAAYRLPIYFLLQLAFSVIGGLAVLYAILQLPVEGKTRPASSMLPYWLLITTGTLFLTAVRFLTGLNFGYFPNVIVVLVAAGLAGLLLTSFIYKGNQ